MVRRMDIAGRSFNFDAENVRVCPTENGTEMDDLLQAGASWHKRARHKGIGRLKDKKRTTRKEYRRLWTEFEAGGFMTQKDLWKVARERMSGTEVHYLRKREIW